MTTLNIEGRRVKVDDAFLSMSPDEQTRVVSEIARSLNLQPSAPAAGRAPAAEFVPPPPGMGEFMPLATTQAEAGQIRSAQQEALKGVASGVGQIATGTAELVPGQLGQRAAEATQYLKEVGSPEGQMIGRAAASIAPFAAGARAVGGIGQAISAIPGVANVAGRLPAFVQGAGRILGGATSGAAGGAAVGATAPTGIVSEPERFAAKRGEAGKEAAIGGAIGGGFGLLGEGVRAARGTMLPEIVGARVEGVGGQQFDDAARLISDAKNRFGIDITPAEALQAVTGGRTGLGDLQRIVEQSRGGAQAFAQRMGDRPEQVAAAVQGQLNEIAPALRNPSLLEPEARKIAEQINQQVDKIRTQATQPFYRPAMEKEINPNAVGAVVKDLRALAAEDKSGQIIAPVLQRLENLLIAKPAQPATRPGPREVPPGMRAIRVSEPPKAAVPEEYVTDVNTLEMARQLLRESADVPLYAAEGISKVQSGKLLDGLKSLGDRLARNIPELQQGRSEYERISRLIDRFKATPTGRFAEAPTLRQQQEVLFPSGERLVPGQEGEIERAFRSISTRQERLRPEQMPLPDVQAPRAAAPQIARQLLRQELAGTSGRTAEALTSSGLPNQYAGAAFQAALQRNPQQFANLQAAFRGADVPFEPTSRLLEVLQATGYRQRPGSQTEINRQFNELVGSGGVPGLMRAASSPLTTARQAATQGAIETRTAELSRILLSGEEGLRTIQRLARRNDTDGEIARNLLSLRDVTAGGLLSQ
jgi:hypothetical protein